MEVDSLTKYSTLFCMLELEPQWNTGRIWVHFIEILLFVLFSYLYYIINIYIYYILSRKKIMHHFEWKKNHLFYKWYAPWHIFSLVHSINCYFSQMAQIEIEKIAILIKLYQKQDVTSFVKNNTAKGASYWDDTHSIIVCGVMFHESPDWGFLFLRRKSQISRVCSMGDKSSDKANQVSTSVLNFKVLLIEICLMNPGWIKCLVLRSQNACICRYWGNDMEPGDLMKESFTPYMSTNNKFNSLPMLNQDKANILLPPKGSTEAHFYFEKWFLGPPNSSISIWVGDVKVTKKCPNSNDEHAIARGQSSIISSWRRGCSPVRSRSIIIIYCLRYFRPACFRCLFIDSWLSKRPTLIRCNVWRILSLNFYVRGLSLGLMIIFPPEVFNF